MVKKFKLTQKVDFDSEIELKQIQEIQEKAKRLGIPLSEVVYIPPTRLRPNPKNAEFFSIDDDKYLQFLKDDIKERGVIVPLIAKRDEMLLAGHRRLNIASELKIKLVPVQYVERELTPDEEIEFLLKDNTLRRQLSADKRIELLKRIYGKKLLEDQRGGDRRSNKAKSKSPHEVLKNSSKITPQKIAEKLGISTKTAERDLARARRDLRNRGGGKKSKSPHEVLKNDPIKAAGRYAKKLAEIGEANPEKIAAIIIEIDTLKRHLKELKRKFEQRPDPNTKSMFDPE